MQRRGDSLVLSASDLSKHLACRHVTEVDRARAEERLTAEPWRDPAVEHLQERGFAHEDAYVRHLRTLDLNVVDLRDAEYGDANAEARVLSAMREGADVIVQAQLLDGTWRGIADLLIRVDLPSVLGDWSYEVTDTKLASETSGGTVLQLSLYSELVERLQGVQPVNMHVVKPGAPFEQDSFRFTDFSAYYRQVKARLEEQVGDSPSELYTSTYPEPCTHCDVCRWWKLCDDRRRGDDHLSFVAGLGTQHTAELHRQGRPTLEAFALAEAPLDDRPQQGSRDTYERLHNQARVQLTGRREGQDVYELLAFETKRGLALLPGPDRGDVWFDIEGDHFYEDGGLEYLFGVTTREEGGPTYESFWALDRAEEKRAFERLIDFLVDRWERFPDMHVYHFAPYEPAAIKRLMGRHGTRQLEVDRLLRGERFIDLHSVTKQGLRASVESYNLKDLERFAGYRREIDLRSASATRRLIGWALERGDCGGLTHDQLALVEGYNREDCEATEALQGWLEERRAELVGEIGGFDRPEASDGDPGDGKRGQHERIEVVVTLLRARLPEEQDAWSEEDKGIALLAELLAYFFREDRCAWWEFFRLAGLDPDELLAERKAIEGLEFIADLGPETLRSSLPVHRYRFPAQDIAIDRDKDLQNLEGDKVGSVVGVDHTARTIDIKRTKKTQGDHPTAVFSFDNVRTGILEDSLLELGRQVAEHGLEGDGPCRAARMLLLKRPPRLPTGELLPQHGESLTDCARRLATLLDGDVLAIQGPPGTGKTHTGARMIVDLVRKGKRVGVTAVSHKVIRNLVEKALAFSRDSSEPGRPIEAVLKTSKNSSDPGTGLTEVKDNASALAAMCEGKLIGGTSWLWARDDMAEAGLDVLFVDEAGQLSLAATLASTRCTHSLVLLGDPQQLQQPQKASHPEGAEIAALEHYLDGHPTMPEDKGVFLEQTWRLHPALCRFTSDLYYEGRLDPHPGCAGQAVLGASPFAGAGFFHVPVEHEGCQSRSNEEVEAIDTLIDGLCSANLTWCDREGRIAALTTEHILVIAPYNAQVAALIDRLPDDIKVGTVDRFQGQEAPVVIYSTTSSSVEDAPRGMSFLFDPHRLNVATSRAQCACIVVGSPRLIQADCKTPEQMRWANGLCALLEMARKPQGPLQ